MDENKLVEKLTDGVTKAAVQIGKAITLFILLSAATATDPFLRRKFGERYFTVWRMWTSLMGWFAAVGLTTYHYVEPGQKIPILINLMANLIILGYGVMSFIHFRAIRRRQVSGELWHSRSRGESIFGGENIIRDLIVDAVIAVVLYSTLPYCAAFYVISRALGYSADVLAKAAFYNRYLDIRDGQIEAQYMETVLRDGYPPHQTAGVFGPLPRRFTGQQRANIARVIAGQYATAPMATPAATSTGQNPQPTPSAPTPSPIFETAKKATSLLRSKRFIYLVAVVLVAFGLVKGGEYIFHALQAKKSQAAQTKVIQNSTPVAPPVVENQPQQPAPVVTPVADVQTPSAPNVVVTPPPQVEPAPVVDSAAVAQAALEKQRQEEQEKIAQERQQVVNQITNSLAVESEKVSKFRDESTMTLDANTNKIAALSYFDRRVLRKHNEEIRESLADLTGKEKAFFATAVDKLPDFSNPQLNTRVFLAKLENIYAQMESDRQLIAGDLQTLATSISNAPAKGSIFNVKITK